MTKRTLLNLKETLACNGINLLETNYILAPDEISYEVIDDVTLLLKFTKNNYDLIVNYLSAKNYKIFAVGGSTFGPYMWLKFTITK